MNYLTLPKTMLVALLVSLAWLSMPRAHAALEIVITEGIDSARPVAVVPFEWRGEGEPPYDFVEVITNNLRRSGRFNPIGLDEMPQRDIYDDSRMDYQAWAREGIEAVLVGYVEPTSNGRYRVS